MTESYDIKQIKDMAKHPENYFTTYKELLCYLMILMEKEYLPDAVRIGCVNTYKEILEKMKKEDEISKEEYKKYKDPFNVIAFSSKKEA